MPIEYRELTPDDDFGQCVQLQREVFGFSDVDVISPQLFRLVSRPFPPTGITVGAFDVRDGKVVIAGILMALATFVEGATYAVMYGVLPEYRDGTLAVKLLRAFRDLARCKGINRLYGVFEPLESNLARLYVSHIGMRGIGYFPDPKGNLPGVDRMLTQWDFDAAPAFNRQGVASPSYPVADCQSRPDAPAVLVPVPDDWLALRVECPEQAASLRRDTRTLFNHYIIERNYTVEGCLNGKAEGGRTVHYVLRRPEV